MVGRRIPHPSSTNYDDEFPLPEAKRLRTSDSNHSVSSLNDQSSGEESNCEDQKPTEGIRREIPDSEEESEGEDIVSDSVRKTDLESALPPIKTDKQAIQDYEAARAAESAELDLKGRLGQRKWIPGKSSIYVDAFNLALETVLEDESHLFDEAEMTLFENWRNLSYEGQYLYVTQRLN